MTLLCALCLETSSLYLILLALCHAIFQITFVSVILKTSCPVSFISHRKEHVEIRIFASRTSLNHPFFLLPLGRGGGEGEYWEVSK